MAVTILSDRSDIQDLLRRHVETLAQEFRDMGYSETSFSFESGRQEEQQQDIRNEPSSDALETAEAEQRVVYRMTSGLDLRL